MLTVTVTVSSFEQVILFNTVRADKIYPLKNLYNHSGKRKAHKHKLFCPVGLGTTPGLSDPGFVLILHSGIPGTIPGTKGGTESLCEKSSCAFFAR